MEQLGMEYVNCNLCGADDSEIILREHLLSKGESFNIVRCRRCGLIYVNPRPTPEKIADYYSEDYPPFRTTRSPIVRYIKKMMIHREARKLKGLKREKVGVLEIGCGRGEVLADLRGVGKWELKGVELSPYASQIAREKFGLDVITGTIFDATFPPESFDVVLMKHVLEHVPNPRETLSEIHRILRDNGKLLLWTPNIKSLEAQVWGRHWHGLEIPRHLYHFSPETLTKLLQAAHLKVCKIDFSLVPNDWVWSLREAVVATRLFSSVAKTMHIENIFWLVLFAPLSSILGLFKQSGRIKAVAEKRTNG